MLALSLFSAKVVYDFTLVVFSLREGKECDGIELIEI